MKKTTALIIFFVLIIGAPRVARAEESFSDVKPGDWYYQYVTDLAEAGAVSGYPDGTFRPDGVITRVEFATMVLNTMGVDSVNRALRSVGWAARDGGHWSEKIIMAANHYRIAEFGKSTEEWSKPITRAEMAYVGIKGGEMAGGLIFKEKPGMENLIADWKTVSMRRESFQIKQAYSCGILVGKDEAGTFAPDGNATRAEACVMIMRLLVPALRAETEVQNK